LSGVISVEFGAAVSDVEREHHVHSVAYATGAAWRCHIAVSLSGCRLCWLPGHPGSQPPQAGIALPVIGPNSDPEVTG